MASAIVVAGTKTLVPCDTSMTTDATTAAGGKASREGFRPSARKQQGMRFVQVSSLLSREAGGGINQSPSATDARTFLSLMGYSYVRTTDEEQWHNPISNRSATLPPTGQIHPRTWQSILRQMGLTRNDWHYYWLHRKGLVRRKNALGMDELPLPSVLERERSSVEVEPTKESAPANKPTYYVYDYDKEDVGTGSEWDAIDDLLLNVAAGDDTIEDVADVTGKTVDDLRSRLEEVGLAPAPAPAQRVAAVGRPHVRRSHVVQFLRHKGCTSKETLGHMEIWSCPSMTIHLPWSERIPISSWRGVLQKMGEPWDYARWSGVPAAASILPNWFKAS